MPDIIDRLVDDPETVASVATAASGGRQGQVCVTEVLRNPVPLTNMTTAGMARVRGTLTTDVGDLEWATVVKLVQTPTRSPVWGQIPGRFQAGALAELPWRTEAQVYASDLSRLLPEGLRLPRAYRVDELGDERMAIWMEDVAHHTGPWALADYGRAARLLGRMAGRVPEDRLPSDLPLSRRDLRMYLFGRVTEGTMPTLADDATWSNPLIAGTVDAGLRRDLFALHEVAPRLLDGLDALPRTLSHGDACPQNLLRSVGGDSSIVAIDWQFVGLCSIGFDAGQMVAGHAESGELDPSQLPGVLAAVVEEYGAGLRDEGAAVDQEAVASGVVGALVIRSAFTALPVELLSQDDTPQLRQLFHRRAAYARFLVDIGLGATATTPPPRLPA